MRLLLFYLFTFLPLYFLFFHAVDVASVACVHLYQVALVDEQRHTYLNAGLKSCRLCRVGCGIAFYARLAVCYAEIGLNRHFGIEYCAVGSVGNNFYYVALFHEVNTYYRVFVDGYLLVCLLVHEDKARRVFIKVLVGAVLYAHVFKFETHLECAFENTAVGHVLQLCTHNGVAFSWLYMLEVNANPYLIVHTDACALFNFL